MEHESAAKQIDNIIKKHDSWKGDILTKLRYVINQASPDITEEVKWKTPSRPEGLPVWSHDGIVCIAEIWKNDVKLIFFKGAKMKDPGNLFNARLKSSSDRAMEFHEGDKIDESALRSLVIEAVQLNT